MSAGLILRGLGRIGQQEGCLVSCSYSKAESSMEEEEESVEAADRGVASGVMADVEQREMESQDREEMLSVLIV